MKRKSLFVVLALALCLVLLLSGCGNPFKKKAPDKNLPTVNLKDLEGVYSEVIAKRGVLQFTARDENSASIVIRRADGSVAIQKLFTKATFEGYIDAAYRKAGILEGLVFDEVDDQQLEFAASICLPQTDEYIPLEVKIDNFGNVKIARDSQMDTNGSSDNDE